jgi:hypothetical protein
MVGAKSPGRTEKFLGQVPIKPVALTDLPGDAIFEVEAADGAKSFCHPKSEEVGGELVAGTRGGCGLHGPSS